MILLLFNTQKVLVVEYEVNLPQINDHSLLLSNFEIALKRSKRFINKLGNDSYYVEYKNVFGEWLKVLKNFQTTIIVLLIPLVIIFDNTNIYFLKSSLWLSLLFNFLLKLFCLPKKVSWKSTLRPIVFSSQIF